MLEKELELDFFDDVLEKIITNLLILSEEEDKISFKNFNYWNKEHRVFLRAAQCCIAWGRGVCVKGSRLKIWRINYKSKYNDVLKASNDCKAIDLKELISFMKEWLMEVEQVNSKRKVKTFKKIYKEYYKESFYGISHLHRRGLQR